MRIVLVAPILMYIQTEHYGLALTLVLVAGISDVVDGYLAKAFNWQTRLGELLDPFADKLLVGMIFITLAINGFAPLWLAALVILRDIVIIGGTIVYNFLLPTRVSKLNTTLQVVFIIFVLSQTGFGWPGQIVITLIGACMTVTLVVSGVDYVASWLRCAREKRLQLTTAGVK